MQNFMQGLAVTSSPTQFTANDNYIRFRFFEMMNIKMVSKSNGRGHVEKVPLVDENLIRKINALVSNNQTYFSTQASSSLQQAQSSRWNGGMLANQIRQSTVYFKMLKCESKLVKFIFEINGLVATDRHDWNVLWTHTQGKNYFYERLSPFQKINHFPASSELTRKDRLAFNVRRMQTKFQKQYFDIIPETFILPEQWKEFSQYFNKQNQTIRQQILLSNGQEAQSGHRPLLHNFWIAKPTCSSRGRGIYIVNNLKDVVKGEQQVVSRYLDNPLLIQNHKFDLRLYVVITCYDPLRFYIYREGLVRFASRKYSNADLTSEESKFTHLTNYSINKKNDNFVQNEDASEADSGYKWSLSAFCQHFEDIGIDTALMWTKIYDVIIKSLLCIEQPTKENLRASNVHRSNCFELLGYDILLDANM